MRPDPMPSPEIRRNLGPQDQCSSFRTDPKVLDSAAASGVALHRIGSAEDVQLEPWMFDWRRRKPSRSKW